MRLDFDGKGLCSVFDWRLKFKWLELNGSHLVFIIRFSNGCSKSELNGGHFVRILISIQTVETQTLKSKRQNFLISTGVCEPC